MENLDRGAYYIRQFLYSLTFPMCRMSIEVPNEEIWGIRVMLEPASGILYPFQCFYNKNLSECAPYIRFALDLNIKADRESRSMLLSYLMSVNLKMDYDCCFIIDSSDEVLLTGDIRVFDSLPSYSQFLNAICNLLAIAACYEKAIKSVVRRNKNELEPNSPLSAHQMIRNTQSLTFDDTRRVKLSLTDHEVLCPADSVFSSLYNMIDKTRNEELDARIEDEFKHYKKQKEMLERYSEDETTE